MISSVVENEVFKHFKEGNFETGEKILRKLSFRLNNENTETKRLVLYNLAWVQDELGRVELAKKNIVMIRDIIENDEEYKRENIENYYRVLSLYIELFKDEITVEEKIKINQEKYNCCYDKTEQLSGALISKFNIASLKNDTDEMVDVIQEIHNWIMEDIYIDSESKEKNDKIRNQLKEVRRTSLLELKEKDIHAYNELFEELFNSTNSSIGI